MSDRTGTTWFEDRESLTRPRVPETHPHRPLRRHRNLAVDPRIDPRPLIEFDDGDDRRARHPAHRVRCSIDDPARNDDSHAGRGDSLEIAVVARGTLQRQRRVQRGAVPAFPDDELPGSSGLAPPTGDIGAHGATPIGNPSRTVRIALPKYSGSVISHPCPPGTVNTGGLPSKRRRDSTLARGIRRSPRLHTSDAGRRRCASLLSSAVRSLLRAMGSAYPTASRSPPSVRAMAVGRGGVAEASVRGGSASLGVAAPRSHGGPSPSGGTAPRTSGHTSPPTEFTRTSRATRSGRSWAARIASAPPNECPTSVTGPSPVASRNRPSQVEQSARVWLSGGRPGAVANPGTAGA